MPTIPIRLIVFLVIALGAGGVLNAQSPTPCTLGLTNYFSNGPGGKPGVAYSATLKSTFEQKLSDGNAIHAVIRTHQARDSSGRTKTESIQNCRRGEDGQPIGTLNINVHDPVAKVNMNWQVNSDLPKVTTVVHYEDHARTQSTPAEISRQIKATQIRQPPRSESHREDLGTKTINGVLAVGSRMVRIIPAGEEGNDEPLQVIDEFWRAKDLGMELIVIRDDPRRGRWTNEYEELNFGEPDASVFAAPADYTVKEIHPNVEAAGVQ
jgi:hypothetical protein